MDLDLAVLKEEVGAHLSRAVDMGETVVGKAGTVQERKRVGIGEAELLARRTSDKGAGRLGIGRLLCQFRSRTLQLTVANVTEVKSSLPLRLPRAALRRYSGGMEASARETSSFSWIERPDRRVRAAWSRGAGAAATSAGSNRRRESISLQE